MGPKKAKELLRAATARMHAVQGLDEHGEPVDFVEHEHQLPPPGQGKRTRYIESLTLGRDGFVLTPGSALMGHIADTKTKALDLSTSWESPIKI